MGLIVPKGFINLDANRYSHVYRMAFQNNDLVAALNEVETKRSIIIPGLTAWTTAAQVLEIIDILKANGCESVMIMGFYV